MKGFTDLFLMAGVLVFLVFSLIFIAIIGSKLSDALDPIFGSTPVLHTMLTGSSSFNWALVNVIPLAIIGVWLGAIFTAWILPSHPIFLVLWVAFSFVMQLGIMAITNVLWLFINTDVVLAYVSNFTLLYYFVKYFPWVFPIFSGIYAIILYGRIQESSVGGAYAQ